MQYHLHGFKIDGTQADFIDKDFEDTMKDVENSFFEERENFLKQLNRTE